MEIETLASGSTGNCYFIQSGGSKIMIECGIPIDKIKRGCGYRLHEIDFCLLTHGHKDHCKAAQDVLDSGIDLYCSGGTAGMAGLHGHRLHLIKALKQFRVGPWTILPFDTEHDAEEPLGFLIANGEDKLLFATDTFFLKYTFQWLTHIMLEANYSLDTLDENIASGYVDPSRRSRLLRSHMSLEQCLNTLKANDLSHVKEIYLIHMSFKNGDAERFKRTVQRQTGKPVYVC